jgi:monofunctional biosynthetic peptidoglycan transglycosylase
MFSTFSKFTLALLILVLSGSNAMSMNIDFSSLQESAKWRVSNDTVMGGVSRSSVDIDNGRLVFSGFLSLENNGGFTSVWRSPVYPLMGSSGKVVVKVIGDGRTYQLRFRSRQAPNISYFATFSTVSGKSKEHVFTQNDFRAVWRGRQVTNAPSFNWQDTTQIGFLLADKQAGEFTLVVEKIAQLHAI